MEKAAKDAGEDPQAFTDRVSQAFRDLTVTMGLGRGDNGADLCDQGHAPLILAPDEPVDPARIRTGPRVGVSGPGGDGTAYPWRFWLDGEPSVSAYRPGVVRSRR